MKYTILAPMLIIAFSEAQALPEIPVINRDVHMTEANVYTRPTIPTLQTSSDRNVLRLHR